MNKNWVIYYRLPPHIYQIHGRNPKLLSRGYCYG